VGGRSNTLNPLNPLAPDERGAGWMRRLPIKSHLKFQHTTGLIVAIHLAFGAFICLFLLVAKKLHGSTHKCSNPFSRLIPRRSRSESPVVQPQPNLWLSKYEQAYSMDKRTPEQGIENCYPYVGTNARLTTPVAALLPFPHN